MSNQATTARTKVDLSAWQHKRDETGLHYVQHREVEGLRTPAFDKPGPAFDAARVLQQSLESGQIPAGVIVEGEKRLPFVEPTVTETEPPDAELIVARLEFVETRAELKEAIDEEQLQSIFEGEPDARFTEGACAQLKAALDACDARIRAGEFEADSQKGANNTQSAICNLQFELLDSALIRTDGGTQARAALDEKTVNEYSDAMLAGVPFPPVVVFYDGTDYWLGDGFHRHAATVRAELAEIKAEIRAGTRRDAVLFAVGANARHGLRRTDADKRRSVETLLRDEEWSQWSNREIARMCDVTHSFVGDVRESLSGVRSQMEVKAQRGGREYTVSTANLAGRKADTLRVADSSSSDEDEKEATAPAEATANSPAGAAPAAISAEAAGLNSPSPQVASAGAGSITVRDRRRFVESMQAETKPDRMAAIEKRLKGRSLLITHTLMPKGLGVMITVNVSGARGEDALNSKLFPLDKVSRLTDTEYELITQRLDAEKGKAMAAPKKVAIKVSPKAASAKKSAPEHAKGKAWDKSPLNPVRFKKGSKLVVNVSGRDQQAEVVGVAPDDNRKLRVKIGVKTYDFFVAELPLSKGGAKKAGAGRK